MPSMRSPHCCRAKAFFLESAPTRRILYLFDVPFRSA